METFYKHAFTWSGSLVNEISFPARLAIQIVSSSVVPDTVSHFPCISLIIVVTFSFQWLLEDLKIGMC